MHRLAIRCRRREGLTGRVLQNRVYGLVHYKTANGFSELVPFIAPSQAFNLNHLKRVRRKFDSTSIAYHKWLTSCDVMCSFHDALYRVINVLLLGNVHCMSPGRRGRTRYGSGRLRSPSMTHGRTLLDCLAS